VGQHRLTWLEGQLFTVEKDNHLVGLVDEAWQ